MNIKGLTSVFLMAGTVAFSASAAPSYLIRDKDVDSSYAYNVKYDYKDKPKNGLYITGRVDMNMLSWENNYTSDDVVNNGSDKYSMETIFGGNFAAGKRFNYFWRWEIEAGYLGEFSDADATAKFTLEVPYAIANMMYDFTGGIYLGAGVGLAMPTTTWDGDLWIYNDNRTQQSISPMGAFMIGYSAKLDDNFVLDLRYRLAGFKGTTHNLMYETNQIFNFQNDIGMILDSSVSVGLRYEF